MTVNDLPELIFKAALQELGLLDAIEIGAQELDPLRVQLLQFRPDDLEANERGLAIICSSNSNPLTAAFYHETNFTLVFCGTKDAADIVNVRMIAEIFNHNITKVLPWGDRIFGIVSNGVFGPFYEKTGRAAYEINGRLMIQRVRETQPIPPEPPAFGFGIWGPLGVYG